MQRAGRMLLMNTPRLHAGLRALMALRQTGPGSAPAPQTRRMAPTLRTMPPTVSPAWELGGIFRPRAEQLLVRERDARPFHGAYHCADIHAGGEPLRG